MKKAKLTWSIVELSDVSQILFVYGVKVIFVIIMMIPFE